MNWLLCKIGLCNKQVEYQYYPSSDPGTIITHGVFTAICSHCGKGKIVAFNYTGDESYCEMNIKANKRTA
jgi:hypothetical protein